MNRTSNLETTEMWHSCENRYFLPDHMVAMVIVCTANTYLVKISWVSWVNSGLGKRPVDKVLTLWCAPGHSLDTVKG